MTKIEKKKTITKKQVMFKVHKRTGVGLDVVVDVVDALLDEIQEAVCQKKTVKFNSFGVWEPLLHTGTGMRNPHANEAMECVPFVRPWHRCADDFKKRVKKATLDSV